MLFDLTSTNILAIIGADVACYLVGIVIYRRYFHRLASIPGPFLPAVTTCYQTYFNGKYYLEIERLHKIHGPVLRILPNEVHLSAQSNFDRIYQVGFKYSKSVDFYRALTMIHATHTQPSNAVYRHKRARLIPMFSREMVLELETIIHENAKKVIDIAAGEPFDLHHTFRCVSVDVITYYAFGKSYNLLSTPDLGAYFFKMVRGLGPAWYAFQQFPGMLDLVLKIPPWVQLRMGGALKQVTSLQQEGVKQLEIIQSKMREGSKIRARPTIFSELLDPINQDGKLVPPIRELKDDVYSILAAAVDTTGNALAVATYKVIGDAEIYAKLREELLEVFPGPDSHLDFLSLEKLPYLTAVIKEALRLSFGVPGRLPRVVPEPGATFNGYFLPAGTNVSMSSWICQRIEDVFPDAMKFDPTRWLDKSRDRALNSYMMPFGGGSRICVGMPLAYCELYVTLGMFFHKFGNLKVYKTTDYDMEFEDCFSSCQIAGRNWFKAIGT